MYIGGIGQNYNNIKEQHLFRKAADDTFEKTLREAARKNDDEKLRKTCMEFEAIFLRMIYTNETEYT